MLWLEISNGPCANSDTINITVVDNSSIDENDLSGIMLYPNPANGIVHILSKSDEIPSAMVFYNAEGVRVMSLHPLNDLIDINGLEPDVYIVELTFREYILKRRLIII